MTTVISCPTERPLNEPSFGAPVSRGRCLRPASTSSSRGSPPSRPAAASDREAGSPTEI